MHTADQWIDILKSASSANATYFEVTHDMIKDYKTYFCKLGPKHVDTSSNDIKKWAVTSYKIIEYTLDRLLSLHQHWPAIPYLRESNAPSNVMRTPILKIKIMKKGFVGESNAQSKNSSLSEV